MLDEHFYVPALSEPEGFIGQLRESLAAIDHLGQPLEIASLANIIGLLLGRAIRDTVALVRDFQQGFAQGFAHGLDLARHETHNQ